MQALRARKWIVGAVLVTATVATVAVLRRTRTNRPVSDETRRVRDLCEREATRYDSMIRIPERLLFGDGRIWAASQAIGNVLEIASVQNIPAEAGIVARMEPDPCFCLLAWNGAGGPTHS